MLCLRTGPNKVRPAQATFKVQPKMTKWEVKEYLTKIYNLPVKKVGLSPYLSSAVTPTLTNSRAYCVNASTRKVCAVDRRTSSLLSYHLAATQLHRAAARGLLCSIIKAVFYFIFLFHFFAITAALRLWIHEAGHRLDGILGA